MACFLYLEAIFDALFELDRQIKNTRRLGRHFYVSGNTIRLLAWRTGNITRRLMGLPPKEEEMDEFLDLSPPPSPSIEHKGRKNNAIRRKITHHRGGSYNDMLHANEELTGISYNQRLDQERNLLLEYNRNQYQHSTRPILFDTDSDSDSDNIGTSANSGADDDDENISNNIASRYNNMQHIGTSSCNIMAHGGISGNIMADRTNGNIMAHGGISGNIIAHGGISGNIMADGGISGNIMADGGTNGNIMAHGRISGNIMNNRRTVDDVVTSDINVVSNDDIHLGGVGRNGERRLVLPLAGAYFEVSDSE